MHSLGFTNIDNSPVYQPAMNSWSNDKQRFRPPDICPIVPIESGRASLSQPLQYLCGTRPAPQAVTTCFQSAWKAPEDYGSLCLTR